MLHLAIELYYKEHYYYAIHTNAYRRELYYY